MSGGGDLHERLLAIFRVEAHEHLQAMVTQLTALAATPRAPQAMQGLFRAVHTLKGAARSVGLEAIEAPCQALESVMSRAVRDELALTPPLVDLLHDAVAHLARSLLGTQDSAAGNALVGRLQEVAAAGETVAPRAPGAVALPIGAPSGPAPQDTIRVFTAVLDRLLFCAEDLSMARLAAAEGARQAGALLEAIAAAGRRASAPLRPVELTARDLVASLNRHAQTLGRTVDTLVQELRRIRMAPASTVLDLLPLMVRDLAREKAKEVELSLRGTDLELDRRVLEALKDPLIQLMRNAIDHGIETPDARVAAQKPARGRLTLSLAEREGGWVQIRLADDGAGVDLEAVRAASVRGHLVSADAAASLRNDQVLELVFRSGLSTSPVITRVSGHGLGMSIVKERVERLGGTVRLDSERGQGTTATMLLPATITTLHGLMVRDGDQPFLIPLDAIERVWRVRPEQIVSVQGRPSVLQDGSVLPCVRLRTVLRLAADDGPPAADAWRACVAVRSAQQRVALMVDEIAGHHEVLVKPLHPPLVRVRNVAGAGILGGGEVVMILRPADLVRSAQTADRAAVPRAPAARRQPVVLVVDDSITTRAVEASILEAAGFQVRVAADGVEAWESLTRDPCDLVVSDVDMPRMDGFALTERIRTHPQYRELPVVLVTAMESRDDKEKGIRLGANAYVFKSSFAQSNLLEIIRRLI